MKPMNWPYSIWSKLCRANFLCEYHWISVFLLEDFSVENWTRRRWNFYLRRVQEGATLRIDVFPSRYVSCDMQDLWCTMDVDCAWKTDHARRPVLGTRAQQFLSVVWQEKPGKDETQNCGNHLKPLEDADMAGTGPYAPWIEPSGWGHATHLNKSDWRT